MAEQRDLLATWYTKSISSWIWISGWQGKVLFENL